MPKDKKKDKQERKQRAAREESGGPADALRGAVEQALSATALSAASTRDRAQELVDEITSAAGRVRDSLEDFRVLEDLRGLRTEVESLRGRVEALEAAQKRPAPARASAGTKPAGTKPAGTKPAGTRAPSTPRTRRTAQPRTRAPKPPATDPAPAASEGRS